MLVMMYGWEITEEIPIQDAMSTLIRKNTIIGVLRKFQIEYELN